MSIAFLLTTLVVVATPGTGVVHTLAAALSRGRRASIVAAVGCTLGIVPHLLATVTGVAALLHASASAFQVLKYAGVAYLLYMAWATVRDKEALVVEEQRAAPVSARRVIVRGVLINILNPKLTIFFFAFLLSAYGVLAASVRSHVIGRPRVMAWLRRGFAGSFVALGAKLAVTAR
jgi:threonine/homoserine/homoserine lactone efflux protein